MSSIKHTLLKSNTRSLETYGGVRLHLFHLLTSRFLRFTFALRSAGGPCVFLRSLRLSYHSVGLCYCVHFTADLSHHLFSLVLVVCFRPAYSTYIFEDVHGVSLRPDSFHSSVNGASAFTIALFPSVFAVLVSLTPH